MRDEAAGAPGMRRLLEREDEAGIAVLDPAGRIREGNAALAEMGGAPGGDAAALFAGPGRADVARAIAAAIAGPPAPPVLEARLARAGLPPDAAVEVICRPLRGEPGALMRVVDVTARRRMQRQMEEGARLQAVGRLAGGVAHDFNNLLAAISGAAEAVLARDICPATRDDAAQILDAAGRGARLVRQLLAFASRQALAPRVLALGDAVAALAPLLARLLGARIVLEADVPRPGPSVRVDPGQLDQVLMNLVVNARDAMPEGGRIAIAAETVVLAAPEVTQGGVIPAGAWAVLSVSDSGPGIAPDVLPRIFEPFFTTRRGDGGTGLGLSTVLGILRQSGGHVSVESRPGQGTRFRLWFPAVAEAAAAMDAPAVAVADTPARPRRVLLVEDEAALRMLARRALETAGHRVCAVEDAQAALAAVAEGFAPDLLVTDITMPGEMDGLGLAEAMRARSPGLPVVLVSGYAEATVGEGLGGRGMRFLEKPFRMADLIAAVGVA